MGERLGERLNERIALHLMLPVNDGSILTSSTEEIGVITASGEKDFGDFITVRSKKRRKPKYR